MSEVLRLPETLFAEHGVITLRGYGVRAWVDRGHLVLEDGIGPRRRLGRFPRVGHGIKRVVAIGSDGMVSLAAMRWLSDQGAAFVMLERDGKRLVQSGPVGPNDARLRRAQSLAHHSGAAVKISRDLIHQKLSGQARLVRELLCNHAASVGVASAQSLLASATTIQEIRQIESLAAKLYWTAWRDIPINFPSADLKRVPQHWRRFGTRTSVLTGSPRLAVNP